MTEWNNPLRLLSDYKLDLQKMDNCFSLMDKKNLPNAQKHQGVFVYFVLVSD